MRYQEASIVVSRPMAEVQAELSHVETWPAFVNSLAEVEKVAHERWLFRLIDPADRAKRQEARVVVRVDHERHEVRWKTLEGPKFTGCFSLEPVDGQHTRVRLALTRYPDRTMTAAMEMLLPRTQRAVIDLQELDKHLHGAHPAPPVA